MFFIFTGVNFSPHWLPFSPLSNHTVQEVVSDQDILRHLQSDHSRQQDQGFRALYQQYYGMIEQLVIRNSGAADDAADVFQDGLVALFRKVRQADFQLTASLKTLLYAICRNLWLMKLRKRKREAPITEVHQETVGIDAEALAFLENNDRNELLARGLQKLGEDCQRVLQLYYFEKCKMKSISEQMGYAGEQVAKNKKSRCMRKLREWVLNQPQAKEMMQY